MRNILYITLLLFSFTSYSSAQVVLDGNVTVKNVNIEQVVVDEYLNLHVSMDVDVTWLFLKSDNELRLIPRFTDGEQFKDLPAIVVTGRKNAIFRERNPHYFIGEENAVILRKEPLSEGAQIVPYSAVIPYETWMNGSDLEIVENSCGCATTLLASNDYKLDHFLLPPPAMTPYISYVEPVVEEQKRRSIEASAYLDFPVGQTVIRPSYRNNSVELGKISQSINQVVQDGDITVSSIKLTGHASPEGSYALNDRLARGRTDALKRYLISIYPQIPAKSFEVSHVAENWQGLIKMLNESSYFMYKDEVLRIIQTTPNLDAREQKIRRLDGGRAFRALVNDYFPALRNTSYEIKYIIRQFTTEEAQEIVWTQPQKLSLEEIYRVSELYKEDKEKYAELFEIAVRMYPTDNIANLNAATSALVAKNLDAAKRYLDRIDEEAQEGEYFNNRGVCSYMEEDFETAKTYFEKAVELESANAVENLKQLEEKFEYDRLTSKNK